MFKKLIVVIFVIIGIFLGYVALLPKHSIIAREILINSNAENLFPYLNNRTLANSWNPWLKMDPKSKITLSGPEVGVGAKTSWDSEGQLGTGSATVVESVPNKSVKIKLEYLKPFEMSQDAFYILEPQANQTKVIWKVESDVPFVNRIFCVFMNMDKMVGDVFMQGLSELKGMVEAQR